MRRARRRRRVAVGESTLSLRDETRSLRDANARVFAIRAAYVPPHVDFEPTRGGFRTGVSGDRRDPPE